MECLASSAMSGQTGVVVDPLFVALTRPAMAWGVTYAALLVNAMLSVELFLLTKSIPWLLVCVPIHGVFWLLCLSEPRVFDLLLLWGRTRGPGGWGNAHWWQANSYSPLTLHVFAGRRPRCVQVVL